MKHKLVVLSLVLISATAFASGRNAKDRPRTNFGGSVVAAANAALPKTTNPVASPKAPTQPLTTTPTPATPAKVPSVNLDVELANATKIDFSVTGEAKAFYTKTPLNTNLESLRKILADMQKDTGFQTWLKVNEAAFKKEVVRAWGEKKYYEVKPTGFFASIFGKSTYPDCPDWVIKLLS